LCPPDVEREIKNLHRKVKAGTDFFITQPIYRAQDGPSLLERYEARYGKLNKPILAGILPLVSVRHANFLHNEVPGIFIPEEIRKRVEAADEAGGGVKVGVEIAVELIEQIKEWASGVYLMPQFHKFDMVAEIVEKVNVAAEPRQLS
jgi:homocysteine S-methyltransferase